MESAFGLPVKIISKIRIRKQERREREKNFQFSFGKSCCLLIVFSLLQNLLGKRGKNISCSLPNANASLIWWKHVCQRASRSADSEHDKAHKTSYSSLNKVFLTNLGHWTVFDWGTQCFTQVFLAVYFVSGSTCSFLRKSSETPRTTSQVLGAGTVLQARGRGHCRRTCLDEISQPDPASIGVHNLLLQTPPPPV